MDKVKIVNIKTGAIEEVKKELAGDYIATGNWKLKEDKKIESKEATKPIFSKKEDK